RSVTTHNPSSHVSTISSTAAATPTRYAARPVSFVMTAKASAMKPKNRYTRFALSTIHQSTSVPNGASRPCRPDRDDSPHNEQRERPQGDARPAAVAGFRGQGLGRPRDVILALDQPLHHAADEALLALRVAAGAGEIDAAEQEWPLRIQQQPA